MGQGLFIEVAQVVSECFNIPVDYVHISGTNTDEVPNTSATAASLAPILMVWLRGKQLLLLNREYLNTRQSFSKATSSIEFKNGLILSGNKSMTFKELAFSCWKIAYLFHQQAFIKHQKSHGIREKFRGSPYFYFTWGAAVSEAIIDIDTGESRILGADIFKTVGALSTP